MKINHAASKILMVEFSGYHQIKMAYLLSLKADFVCSGGIKYYYLIMDFDIVNNLINFGIMIYDLKDH